MAQGEPFNRSDVISAKMNRIHSYVVEHDVGFAPNPFWGCCTLAYCKPKIRQYSDVGDIVIGTGSKQDNLHESLIYWMSISSIINFDEYWRDNRFSCKRPVLSGSRMQHYGDNIYYTDPNAGVVQLDSFHSEVGGVTSRPNMELDIGSTDRVLIGGEFAYFGKRAPLIPNELRHFIKKGPSHKNRFSAAEQQRMIEWVHSMPERGLIGMPAQW